MNWFLFNNTLKVGTVLNQRYEVIKFIGRGSYGFVYLAVDRKTNTKVVVKQHRQRRDHNSIQMLKKEAETLSSLRHQSIPSYIELFEEKHKWFLVMDYIDGSNFEDLILLQGKSYNEKDSLQILFKALTIVSYLHENRLLHRDLRLPNIIKKDSELFIIDFGLAIRLEREEAVSLTDGKSEKELFKEQSFKGDFYALGHFLLFLLYSTYEPRSKQEQSWEEELIITKETKRIIRKLLRIEDSYQHITDITQDVSALIDEL